MAIISSTTYFCEMKTADTRNQDIICMKNHLIKPPPLQKKLEDADSSYVYGIYISTHLDAWCRVFQR